LQYSKQTTMTRYSHSSHFVCVCACVGEGWEPVMRDLTVFYLIDTHMTRDSRHRRVPIYIRAYHSSQVPTRIHGVCHHTRLVLWATIGLYRRVHGEGRWLLNIRHPWLLLCGSKLFRQVNYIIIRTINYLPIVTTKPFIVKCTVEYYYVREKLL